jgi:hypothetical protein
MAVDPGERPTRPRCGYPAGLPQGVPVLACNRLQRIMELQDRLSKALAPGRRRSGGLREHQHFNRLAGIKREALQDEFAMLTNRSVSPVCLHALIINDLVRCPRDNWTGPFHVSGGADDRFSSSVREGLRPAEFHEKQAEWQNGKAARRGRQRSGEVEAVRLFDPEHARFERIIGRRSSPLGSGDSHVTLHIVNLSRALRAAQEKRDGLSSRGSRRSQEDVGGSSG